jgi:hypothetical protein
VPVQCPVCRVTLPEGMTDCLLCSLTEAVRARHCRCQAPVPDRCYAGSWLCRACGQLQAAK